MGDGHQRFPFAPPLMVSIIEPFESRENVLDVANTPDGDYLVIGSDDMHIYLLKKP